MPFKASQRSVKVVASILFTANWFLSVKSEIFGEKYVRIDLKNKARNTTVDVGSNVTLYCGTPAEIHEGDEVQWKFNGLNADFSRLPRMDIRKYLANLHHMKPEDSGYYQCNVISNMTPKIDRKVNILVNEPQVNQKTNENSEEVYDYGMSEDEKEELRIDAQNSCSNIQSTEISEMHTFICFDFEDKKKMEHFLVRATGSTANIYCNIRGYPTPNVTWRKDDILVDEHFNRYIQKNALVINDLTTKDQAIYTCSASNTAGTIAYKTRLDVPERAHNKPVFLEYPRNITALLGETVEFKVKILSDPEYAVSWMKHSLEDPANTSEIQNGPSDNLVLQNVTFEHIGWYSCIVGSSMGRVEASAYLSVLTEPDMDSFDYLQPSYEFGWSEIIIFSIVGIILLAMTLGIGILILNFYRGETWNSELSWNKEVVIEDVMSPNDHDELVLPSVKIRHVPSSGKAGGYNFLMDEALEFPRSNLEIREKLGEGQFGEVLLGFATGLNGTSTLVAVKKLKPIHTDEDLLDLVSEMITMKHIGKHRNVVNLLGCCSQDGELLVLMEFAEFGNLRDYLRINRPNFIGFNFSDLDMNIENTMNEYTNCISFRDLIQFAYQIAHGMDYLSSKKYIHRDLAARNILVCADKVVKIADFGLTRSTFISDYYRKTSDGRVPLKWMAPETIFDRVYTTQSDIWSYGVLLYEILTLGGTPYPSIPDLNNLLDFLKNGNRMDKPQNCPDEVYEIMLFCWRAEPEERPKFPELVNKIKFVLQLAGQVDYFEFTEMDDCEPYIETPKSTPEQHSIKEIMFDPDFLENLCNY